MMDSAGGRCRGRRERCRAARDATAHLQVCDQLGGRAQQRHFVEVMSRDGQGGAKPLQSFQLNFLISLP